MEKTVKERLIEFIKSENLSINKFEKLAGLSVGYLRQLRKEPSPSKIKSIILAFPQLNRNWLLSGEGEMLKQKEAPTTDKEAHLNPASVNPDYVVSVKFIDMRATASFVDIDAEINPVAETINIIKMPGEDLTQQDAVFPIYGESMYPQIPNGSFVLGKLIRPAQWHLAKGVIMINYDNGFAIKRILKNRLDQDNYLLLGSDNPEFPKRLKVPLSSIREIYQASRIVSYDIH